MTGVDSMDYQPARAELAIVHRKLPNSSEALWLEAMIDRHHNQWENAVSTLQTASTLDPRNAEILDRLRHTYFEMRRYRDAEQILRQEAANGRTVNPWVQISLADIRLAQGDPKAAQLVLEQVPLDFSPVGLIWATRFHTALYLHDYEAAKQVIATAPSGWTHLAFDDLGVGLKDKLPGRAAISRRNWRHSRQRAGRGNELSDKPDGSGGLLATAIFDAALGRKEQAIRRAQRAVEICPTAKDSLNGPRNIADLALVYAWTGEHEHAFEQLEIVAAIPNGPTYGDLLLNPCWDDLRRYERFDKIVAAAKAASR